jgi:phosphoglycolate phosphatase
MIGDTEYDMEMARNARTRALAVSYGVHERERLLRHAPLDCIDSIDQLISWLDRA